MREQNSMPATAAADCEEPSVEGAMDELDELRDTLQQDRGVQVSLAELTSGSISLLSLLDTDQKLSTMTGMPSFDVLTALERLVQVELPSVRDVERGIIVTLMRLKTGLSFTALGVLLGTDRSTCSRLFGTILPVLAAVLKDVLAWPSKDKVVENMPKCFAEFRNVRVVLDCTEVSVERHSCLDCRVTCYSHYHGGESVKVMIGCSPAGTITFVSEAYGGKASDKKIFCDSGLMEKLESYVDAVMVDKGFMIEEECLRHAIELVRPPFLRGDKQLSAADAKRTRSIARARVHVERVIQRVKQFAILQHKLRWTMMPYVNHIFTVVCALTNLSSSILADDKF